MQYPYFCFCAHLRVQLEEVQGMCCLWRLDKKGLNLLIKVLAWSWLVGNMYGGLRGL